MNVKNRIHLSMRPNGPTAISVHEAASSVTAVTEGVDGRGHRDPFVAVAFVSEDGLQKVNIYTHDLEVVSRWATDLVAALTEIEQEKLSLTQ